MQILSVYMGFELWGVWFTRDIRSFLGYDRFDNTVQYDVNLITNYAALKHLAPTGRKYVGANDNNEGNQVA